MATSSVCFAGACVTNPVPFTEGDEVNEEEYRRHVEFMVEGGVNMLMPVPMVGNGPQLSEEERLRVIELTVEQAAGRVGVFPCCYVPAGTRNTVEFIRELASLGADGAYLPTPILWQSGSEAMYAHYATILEETELPVIIYSCPDTTGSAIAATDVARLIETYPGRVLGFKQQRMSDLPGDLAVLADKVNLAPACLDRFTFAGLQLGCKAQITIGGALVPTVVTSIFDLWERGEHKQAKELFDRYLPFFELPPMRFIRVTRDYYSGTYYHILKRLGFDFGKPRLPYLWPLPADFLRAIDHVMTELSLGDTTGS